MSSKNMYTFLTVVQNNDRDKLFRKIFMGAFSMRNFNFIKCGVAGWCLEVFWTGTMSWLHHDMSMTSSTSLLMFPIYGLGAFIKPISHFLSGNTIFFRGLVYMVCIFLTEYTTGTILKAHGMCPWNYNNAKYNINGLIRLDYAPVWFTTGLFFEKMLNPRKRGRHTHKK